MTSVYDAEYDRQLAEAMTREADRWTENAAKARAKLIERATTDEQNGREDAFSDAIAWHGVDVIAAEFGAAVAQRWRRYLSAGFTPTQAFDSCRTFVRETIASGYRTGSGGLHVEVARARGRAALGFEHRLDFVVCSTAEWHTKNAVAGPEGAAVLAARRRLEEAEDAYRRARTDKGKAARAVERDTATAALHAATDAYDETIDRAKRTPAVAS